MLSGRSLLFVYNIESGIMSAMRDQGVRLVDTGGERCNLRTITFSPVGMKKEWKRFINNISVPVRLLSRDEFASEFRTVVSTFPAAFLQIGKDLFVFLSTDEINRCTGLEDLIGLIEQRLLQFKQ